MSTTASQPRHGTFILLRRLRRPLVVLIAVYAVSVLGFTVIVGQTPDGQPWRMSFLHAFYFVSFLGTTIGLGEIPYPFSDAQRLWATASIYAAVTAWLYAIGSLFAVLQDPMFRRISHEAGMRREVRRLREPFYLLCGYDDSAYRVTHELTQDGVRVVVVDNVAERVDAVDVDDHRVEVPALKADASDPKALVLAGLTHPLCAGVVAMTGSDAINTKISLSTRLLAPKLPVLAVARDHVWHRRLAAAGADNIINPFDTFAERMAMAIRTPSLHVIYEALTTQLGTALAEAPVVPRGRWVLCGSGLFARALRRQLQALDIEVFIVDTELDNSSDAGNSLQGDPTDPEVLKAAGVEDADALVAGTPVDIDNLAIVLAARTLNKTQYVAVRQTQHRNTPLFVAAKTDVVMFASYLVAGEVLRHLRAPLLSAFLRRARSQDEAWAALLLAELRKVVGEAVLESWGMDVLPASLPAVCEALQKGETVTLERLLTRVDGGGDRMRAVALMLQRGQDRHLLPDADMPLEVGDQILFCGRDLARTRMRGIALTHALAAFKPPSPPEAKFQGVP